MSEDVPPSAPKYGKYKGRVVNNIDLTNRGCITASVEALNIKETGPALPCTPYAGSGVGFLFIPPVGANVWIEFERGDICHPIWSGCFWDGTKNKAPVIPAVPQVKVIKTDTAAITLNDLPGAGGITIETTNGLKIVLNITGIAINNGAQSVKISPASVSINEGALEVI